MIKQILSPLKRPKYLLTFILFIIQIAVLWPTLSDVLYYRPTYLPNGLQVHEVDRNDMGNKMSEEERLALRQATGHSNGPFWLFSGRSKADKPTLLVKEFYRVARVPWSLRSIVAQSAEGYYLVSTSWGGIYDFTVEELTADTVDTMQLTFFYPRPAPKKSYLGETLYQNLSVILLLSAFFWLPYFFIVFFLPWVRGYLVHWAKRLLSHRNQ